MKPGLFTIIFIWSLFFTSAQSTSKEIYPITVFIPAGPYISGSSSAEKEYAYKLDEKAYGHSATRNQKWYANEPGLKKISLPKYEIMKTPVTNAAYAMFLKETGYRHPQIKKELWNSYGLVHPFKTTRPFQWRDKAPPKGRENHPVVLISHKDASAYSKWLSRKTGQTWRLPTQNEWEKAARGTDGRYFPWGNIFDPAKLNSHDKGTFSTTQVGQFPQGASPYGMLDAAGQVFEWTSSPSGKERYIVKGGSWDDKGCGVCRPAAKHSRPQDIKHILIGFRLVREISK